MKNALFVVVALAVAAGLLAAGWYASAPRRLDRAVAAAVAAPGDAAAGRIVFFASGCGSCHMSPGQSDLLRLGGGRAIKTAFGVFYPPNISPDVTDGLGGWSAQDFARAVLLGVSPTGEHYYPVFPYTSYRRMTPTDVRDLFAFIRTLPAVSGSAPPAAPLLPYSIRRSIGLWKRLYVGIHPLPDAPGRDATWKLGRYLVEGPGHCAECHSPRDVLGGIVAHRWLTGGHNPDGGGFAPDITSAGLKNWTKDQIAEALRTGATPRGEMFNGLMAIVVRSTGELPELLPRRDRRISEERRRRRDAARQLSGQAGAKASARMRSIIALTPLERWGVKCCSRPSSRKVAVALVARISSGVRSEKSAIAMATSPRTRCESLSPRKWRIVRPRSSCRV